MTDQETATRECPYCKEDVKADAIRCKHCHAQIAPIGPTHQGVCPFCKEDIKVDAIRCKHCHADLRPGARLGAGGAVGSVAAGIGSTRPGGPRGLPGTLPTASTPH